MLAAQDVPGMLMEPHLQYGALGLAALAMGWFVVRDVMMLKASALRDKDRMELDRLRDEKLATERAEYREHLKIQSDRHAETMQAAFETFTTEQKAERDQCNLQFREVLQEVRGALSR